MYSYETSGNVTIMIKAIQPTSLMGVTYQAGDVVALFENAYFSLAFNDNNKQVTQGARTMLHYNILNLFKVMIEPKSLTHTVHNFIASKYRDSGKIFIPLKEDVSSDENGIAFLNRIPTNAKTLFIKSKSKENITGYTVDYTTGQITGLPVSSNFISFYYYEEERLISYDLKEVTTPYFQIEIVGQNNINNTSRQMLITIPKASIDVSPTMEFKLDQITAIQLEFIVIDGIATIDYY